jgi:hypothetical protein
MPKRFEETQPGFMYGDGCFKALKNGSFERHIDSCGSCPYPDCCAVFKREKFVFSASLYQEVMAESQQVKLAI